MSNNEKSKKIDELDLTNVRTYATQQYGWNKEHAEQVEADYKCFLKLYAMNPGDHFVSTRDVDDFWHSHILHVGKYVADCNGVFGKLLDHVPVVEEGIDLTPYQDLYEKTQKLFAENFGRQMGQESSEPAICFDSVPQKSAICFDSTPKSAICFDSSPAAIKAKEEILQLV